MCGQMKTMLDCDNPLYDSDYRFREVYLLATAADEEESTVDGALKGLSGWIRCFPKAHLAGTVFGAVLMRSARLGGIRLVRWIGQFRIKGINSGLILLGVGGLVLHLLWYIMLPLW